MSHKRTRIVGNGNNSCSSNNNDNIKAPNSSSSAPSPHAQASVHAPLVSHPHDGTEQVCKGVEEERPHSRRKFEHKEENEVSTAGATAAGIHVTDGNGDVLMQDTCSEPIGASTILASTLPSTSSYSTEFTSSPVSHFTRVMDRLCMANMMRFMSIEERLRTMRVSTTWRRTLELVSSLWTDYQFVESGRVILPNDWYADSSFGYERTISDWLMHRIVSISIDTTRLLQVTRLTQVRHLKLFESSPPNPFAAAPANAALDQANLRLAFHAISNLQSLKIESSLRRTAFSALCDNSPVSPDLSVAGQPALWYWCDTLRELTIPAVPGVLACLTQRTWSKLGILDFSSAMASNPKEDSELRLLLCDPSRLPVLHTLRGEFNCTTQAQVNSLNLFLRALPLRELTFKLILCTNRYSSLTPHVHSLSPNLEQFTLMPHEIGMPATHEERIYEWHCLLNMHHVHTLNVENIVYLPISLLEVFEAIGNEAMPHLHTLAITQLTPSLQDTVGKNRVVEIMRGMTILTSLSVKYFFTDQATHDASFHFVDYLHEFPSLLSLKLGIYQQSASINYSSLKWSDQLFTRFWPELERAITRCARLREFSLPSMDASAAMRSHMSIILPLLEMWKQRVKHHHHDVRLEKIEVVSYHGDEALSEAIRHLAALPHLTDLSIHVARDPPYILPVRTHPESYFETTHEEGLYYYQLVKLRHLRNLKIHDAYNQINNKIIAFWCQKNQSTGGGVRHFSRLQSLVMRECHRGDDSEEEIEWFPLITLPRLSLLDLPYIGGVSKAVDDANRAGRRPFLYLSSQYSVQANYPPSTHAFADCFSSRT